MAEIVNHLSKAHLMVLEKKGVPCDGCGQNIPYRNTCLHAYSHDTEITYHLCGRCEVESEEQPAHFPLT